MLPLKYSDLVIKAVCELKGLRMYSFRHRVAKAIHLFRSRRYFGRCLLCGSGTLFVQLGDWLREDLRCIRCRSSSRQRALGFFLQQHFPALSNLTVYEAASAGPVGDWLKKHSRRYQSSQYFSDAPFGTVVNGYRNENLESLSFENACFDLVITQDVFEHIERPEAAFREVARVLKPGGSHVFTVPYYPDQPTQTRVRLVDGEPVSAFELEYHDNPIDKQGSLVFTHFGSDLVDTIDAASGLKTTLHAMHDRQFGIEGDSVLVFRSTFSKR